MNRAPDFKAGRPSTEEQDMNHPRIICDPKIMVGKPVIKGTRIKVELILRWLGKGVTIEKLLEEYPGLTRDDILAAQAYVADYLAEEFETVHTE
jgi:uncharacterized protein (DUF433 family)